MPPSQLDLALAALIDGATTASDIAEDLKIPVERAGIVLWKLRRRGYIRFTGRRVPARSGRGGNPSHVYEVV